MSEWIYESSYPSGEIPGPNTGYRWKYIGEVTLSLLLERSNSGPRYEITRILEDPEIARILASEIDRDAAIEVTSKGEEFVDDPFWQGLTPNQLRGFCREYRLPLPQGYAKNWRVIKYSSNP